MTLELDVEQTLLVIPRNLIMNFARLCYKCLEGGRRWMEWRIIGFWVSRRSVLFSIFEMALFKEWRRMRYILQLIIINLVACVAWFSAIAFAQLEFSEAVTGSVSFPDGAIASIGNLAVFFTCLLRGRLDLENGVRDVLTTNRGPNLNKIGESGLTTCYLSEPDPCQRIYINADVVMLSMDNSNSIRQFMKYVHHSHDLDSILLKCRPLQSDEVKSKVVTAEPCCDQPHRCGCIVVWTEEEEIRMMIDRRMPGTLKRLSDSRCLVPSWECLRRGCHGLSQREEESKAETPEIHAEESKAEILQCDVEKTEAERRLKEDESNAEGSRGGIHVDVEESKAESPAAVCQMLDFHEPLPFLVGKKPICICIPVREAGYDEWTKLMIRFMRSKDQVTREVRVRASEAMEKYIDRSGEVQHIVYEWYSSWSLIVPRLIEVSVNMVLTGWLRVDGFSSALIARRVVRDYLVDTKGTGFYANAFLTRAWIKCSQSGVCQVLVFREGNILNVRTLSCMVGGVNLICSISWGVLIACEGRYAIHSMPPSKPTLLVMLAFIAVALLMDLSSLLLSVFRIEVSLRDFVGIDNKRGRIMVLGVIVMEIVYIVLGSVMVVKGMGIGRWLYSALQGLIWVKWGIGSYLLGDYDRKVCHYSQLSIDIAILVYASAFLLNAILAGVRGKWEY